ncbi:la-related protein 6 [Trichonephila inaurata madagascariensis]|uniref:La-related protein 6 n=1 Tax=Trichonephila inaurata madagascariensis TaxID=2747483 RepID=A0A8X6XNJ3_9ARAC|nr:la-related protein 6 [Trichonephila inaurata madagascariensis]
MNGDALSSNATKSIEHEDCSVENLKVENLKCSASQIEDDFIAPSDELRNKILKQVEYLFSDSNLPKDKFLLKHICRNKEGYVSLKLISSLRKVKALTKDWKVVAYSLEKSEKLQMNSEKTKIRRLEPLPESAEETNMKKVIVIKKSSDTISTEEVKAFLMKFGVIIDVLVMNSKSHMCDVLFKKYMSSFKSTSSFTFAIAEFSNAEEASLAIYHVPNPEDVFIIAPYTIDDSKEGNKIISPNNSPKEGKIKREHRRVYLDQEDYKTSYETTKISSPSLQNSLNYKTSPRIKKSPKEIKNSEDPQITLSCSYKGDGITTVWKPRRQMSITHEKKSVIIIREPRGPDGTIGFHAGRAKANLKTHKIL